VATKPRKNSPKPLTPADWPRWVRPGSRVFIGSYAAAPAALTASLFSGDIALTDVEVIHLHTLGETPWAEPRFSDTVRTNAFVLGPHLNDAVNEGRADYTPAFVFEIPALLRQRVLPVDVALIQVSPPDRKGICTLGVSVDVVAAALETATHIVAQVNPRMPRTCGGTQIPFTRFTAYLEAAGELPELPIPAATSKTLAAIGDYVAQLIDDGCTLRLGTSSIHHAIARALREHRHLGIHSDVLGDPLHALITAGAVDNSEKGPFAGRSIAAFVAGSRALYDFVDGNKAVELHPSDCVNHPIAIAGNHRMVTVHSALQVDLSGQVVADSIGHRFQSGIGSQVDFIRGAALCPEGRPIIALPATTIDGESSIVANLETGAGIVTSRGDVHYVVTEFGIATLRGRSIRERALELVQVAHPDHRADLLGIAKARKWVPVYEKLPASIVAGLGGIAVARLRLAGEPYVMRPLQPSDERRLQDFFYSHTQETIQARYGYMLNRMSRERAYELVNVDQTRDLALAVLEVQGPREVIDAVGRYYLDADGKCAEVAFVTRETMRYRGMARALFERMRTIAAKRGLVALRAQVQIENEAMLGLFRSYPHELSAIDGASAVEVRMPL